MQSSKINDKRQRIELEFPMHCSANILFNYISSPSGLSSWFADDVSVQGNNYIFRWDDGELLEGELVKSLNRKHIKFRWVDGPNMNETLEFIIQKDDKTDDLALIVADYTEEVNYDEFELVWESQVQALKNQIGA